MSSEIMSLEMDVFCLLLLIRILYQMYINREQNDHWNYFYYTIAWACVYLFMDAIWIMNVKHLLTFSKIQSGIFNSFYFCSLAMLVCSWYVYVQKTLHSAVLKHKKILVLTFIPLIFFIGSSLLSYWTHGLPISGSPLVKSPLHPHISVTILFFNFICLYPLPFNKSSIFI